MKSDKFIDFTTKNISQFRQRFDGYNLSVFYIV